MLLPVWNSLSVSNLIVRPNNNTINTITIGDNIVAIRYDYFIVAGAAIDGIISSITENDIVISPSNDPVIGRSARNQSWQIAVR